MLLNGKWNFLEDKNSKLSINEVKNKFEKTLTKEMLIPTNWEIAGLHNYSGSVWFQKKFFLKQSKIVETLSVLKFNGVDYFASVWLNGIYLGNHEGYFQPFNFDVTDKLNFGEENIVIIKVNSPIEEPIKVWPYKKQLIKGIFNHHDCRPGAWSNEFGQDQNTGGIWNDVELFVNEKLFINNSKITSLLSEDFKNAKIKIEISCLTNLIEPKKANISIIVIDSKKNKHFYSEEKFIEPGNSSLTLIFTIDNPILWWSWDLGEPNLYRIDISIKDFNNYSTDFGIRQIDLNENERFILNGKELFLRGTNIIPTQFLSELSLQRIKQIVKLIKEANINIVRIHAHVNRKELYEEFDRQGILLWQDFSLQWTYDDSEKFASNAVSQIKDMVNILYNHPSISFWCCHNEPGEQIKTLDHFLYDAVLSEDQSRIIRLASNYEEHPYDGWYWGNKEHFASTPMGPLVTEFGAQGIPNIKSLEKFIPNDKIFPPEIEKWKYHDFQPDTTFNIAKIELGNSIEDFINNSQNYQSDLLNTAIHFYRRKKNNGINGIFQFMFIDCWPSITWSIVDYYLKKKKAYDTLKECYEPLLLSVNLRQNSYFPNSKINFDFHLINDTYVEYKSLHVVLKIDGREVEKIKNLSVDQNSVTFKNFESMNVKLPATLKLGIHKIQFLLFNKRKLISFNNFDFEVINI